MLHHRRSKSRRYTVVFALTDPSLGAKGMSAFIVEKGMKGFSTGKIGEQNGYQMLRNSRAFLR